MLTIQIFAAGYIPGKTIDYNVSQAESLEHCHKAGQMLQEMNDMQHGTKADVRYKCIMRQGV